MSRARNFNRAYFKTRGRETESITGADVPRELWKPPRPKKPKAELRTEAEHAIEEFMARMKPTPGRK